MLIISLIISNIVIFILYIKKPDSNKEVIKEYDVSKLRSKIVDKEDIPKVFSNLNISLEKLNDVTANKILDLYEEKIEYQEKIISLEEKIDIMDDEINKIKEEYASKIDIPEDLKKKISLNSNLLKDSDLDFIAKSELFLNSKIKETYNVSRVEFTNSISSGSYVEIYKNNESVASYMVDNTGEAFIKFYSKLGVYSEIMNYFSLAFFDDKDSAEEFINKVYYVIDNQDSKENVQWEGIIDNKLVNICVSKYRVYLKINSVK